MDDAAAPETLRRLHAAVGVGDVVSVTVDVVDRARVDDVVAGAGFSLLGARRAAGGWRVRGERLRTLPDTVGRGMALLFVGLNPSLVAADAGYGFAGPTNRFWKAVVAAGLVTVARDPAHALAVDRVGMTDLVKRATPRSLDIEPHEYRTGAARVERLVAWLQPHSVCLVGLEGWRVAIDRRARAGWQPDAWGGRPAYVMPSTSGLNASARLDDLVEHLRVVSGRA